MDTLYKVDSSGKVRVWSMEIEGDKYRTISGIEGGTITASKWTVATPKNVGKANETTGEEQAQIEVLAKYAKKLSGEYHRDKANAAIKKFFKPMLAEKWEKYMGKLMYPVLVQPKLDGIRCILTKDGAFTRTGKPIETIPHIIAVTRGLFEDHPDTILDGELYNHLLKDDFNELVSVVRKAKPDAEALMKAAGVIQYHVYDMPSTKNFAKRWSEFQMHAYFYHEAWYPSIVTVPTYKAYNEEEVDEYYGEFLESGYEGGIIRVNQPYQNKRSKFLLKRKDFQDAEYEVIRIEEGTGNWSGVAKKVFFRNPDGQIVGSGLKGSQTYAREVLKNADKYRSVTIRYFELTPAGVPRFPIAVALHEDERW